VLRGITGYRRERRVRTAVLDQTCVKHPDLFKGDFTAEASDHGSIYTSKAFAAACKALGVTQFMGAVGTSAGNALAESFNATFKREVFMGQRTWPDEVTCRR
jgi:integrase, catalytic region